MSHTDEQDASLQRNASPDHVVPTPPVAGGEPAPSLPDCASSPVGPMAGAPTGEFEPPRVSGGAAPVQADDDRMPAKPALEFEQTLPLGNAMVGAAAEGGPSASEVPSAVAPDAGDSQALRPAGGEGAPHPTSSAAGDRSSRPATPLDCASHSAADAPGRGASQPASSLDCAPHPAAPAAAPLEGDAAREVRPGAAPTPMPCYPAAPSYPEILVARAVRGNLVDASVAGSWAAGGSAPAPVDAGAAGSDAPDLTGGAPSRETGRGAGEFAQGASAPAKDAAPASTSAQAAAVAGASSAQAASASVPAGVGSSAAPSPASHPDGGASSAGTRGNRGAAVFACVLAVLALVLLGWSEVMARPVAAQLGLCLAVVASLLASSALARGSLSVQVFWGVQLVLAANALAVIAR